MASGQAYFYTDDEQKYAAKLIRHVFQADPDAINGTLAAILAERVCSSLAFDHFSANRTVFRCRRTQSHHGQPSFQQRSFFLYWKV